MTGVSSLESNRAEPGGVGLVSGWSYAAEVFEPLTRQLDGVAVSSLGWPAFAQRWLDDRPTNERAPAPSVWVGWSLGGALVLEALRRGRIAPDRVILLNATPRFLEAPGWPGVPEAQWRGLHRAAERNPEAAVAAFRRRFALPGVAGEAGDAADVGGLDWLARLDLRAFLAEVSVPVECWLAPDDPLVPVDWPAQLTLSARVECHRFAETGHAPWYTSPAEMAARLRDALAGRR